MPWTLLAEGTFSGLNNQTKDAVLGTPPARFYLSGDGHRHPPFQWALNAAVKEHFLQLSADKRLCLHVELQPEDVTEHSVPAPFWPVYRERKVFGWELSIFKVLLPMMTLIMEMIASDPIPDSDVVTLDREMSRIRALAWKFGNPHWMMHGAATSSVFRDYRRNHSKIKAPLNEKTESDYCSFILNYYNSAMQYRCDANNFIANNISRIIALYPDDTHLIAVGNAHITTNPVQNYIQIGAKRGLIDPSQE